MSLADRLTPEQRKAYIATARRTQPIVELRRKALKANPRRFKRTLGGMEGADLTFAEWWHRHLQDRASTIETFRITFCRLCSTFAPIGFPVRHAIRCGANPVDDGPYPGWYAAGVLKTLASSRPHCAAA